MLKRHLRACHMQRQNVSAREAAANDFCLHLTLESIVLYRVDIFK